MRISDYVALKVAVPGCGLFRAWRTMVWAIWALLVKPEIFRVEGQDDPIELGAGGGQVWRLLSGVLDVVMGTLKAVSAVMGIALLLVYLALSPLGMVLLRLTARYQVWRNQRRRAKLLAKAREGLEPRQS
jgi:hypothetical protein